MNHKTNFIDKRLNDAYIWEKSKKILFRNDDGKRSINVTCYNEGSPPLEEEKKNTRSSQNAKRTGKKGEKNNFLFLDIFEPFS